MSRITNETRVAGGDATIGGGSIAEQANGRRPYVHVTINTGDYGTVDHTQPGWLVPEWSSQVDRVATLLAEGGGMLMLAGGVRTIVSSNSGDDGQMAFTLLFDDQVPFSRIIGSHCDNPRIGHVWLERLVGECFKMWGKRVPPYPFPPGTGWLDQPWLAVAYPWEMDAFFAFNADRHPLLWAEYEQVLVDAWQTMTPNQKRAMRRNAAANPIIRGAFDAGAARTHRPHRRG